MGAFGGNLLVYEIHDLPDLRMQKYLSVYRDWGSARREALKRQREFLAFLYDVGHTTGLTAALRYDYDPSRDGASENRLRIFLVVNNASGISGDVLDSAIREGFLKDFYSIEREDAAVARLDTTWVCVSTNIIKEEQRAEPVAQLPGVDFYYLPFPFEPDEENDYVFLDRLLLALRARVVFEVVVAPMSPGDQAMLLGEGVQKMIVRLDESTRSMQQPLTARNREATADVARKLFQDYHESLLSDKVFSYALRVLTADAELGRVLAASIALAGTANGKYRVIQIERSQTEAFREEIAAVDNVAVNHTVEYDAFWSTISRALDRYPTIAKLRPLPRTGTLTELGSFFRVLVPSFQPLQTIRIETDTAIEASSAQRSLKVGAESLRPQNAVLLEPNQLKKHVFVSGVTGSGKTTTIINLLVQLWGGRGIPFLVIEPRKTEYRLLKLLRGSRDPVARKVGVDLRVYTLGNEAISPYRLNPFEFSAGVTLNEHLGTLDACFQGALPLWPPLPAIIGEAMEEAYGYYGWRGQDTACRADDRRFRLFPTMSVFYRAVQDVSRRKDYSSDVSKDITTAVEVRLGTLLRRSVGPMFNAVCSRPTVDELLRWPTVLEMDSLNEEQANLMTMFILAQIREHVRTTRPAGSPLEHIIVLEEAHNIVGAVPELPSSGEVANPKGEATKYLSGMLSEIRTLGEGLVIADQIPARMAAEVIKNTNTKIVHRIVSGDDREMIGQTMLMNPSQAEDVARLAPGEAFVYKEGMYFPVKVRCPDCIREYGLSGVPPPFGSALIAELRGAGWYDEARLVNSTVNRLMDILYSRLPREILLFQIELDNLRSRVKTRGEVDNDTSAKARELSDRLRHRLADVNREEIGVLLADLQMHDPAVYRALYERAKGELENVIRPQVSQLLAAVGVVLGPQSAG